jgi:hypothetical protein
MSLIIWYILLLVILYFITNVVVLIVLIVVLLPFNYTVFILYEFIVIIFIVSLLVDSSTNERGVAIYYLVFFRYVLRIVLLMNNTLMIIRVIIIVIGYAKLPLYRLHIWLPKVHAEASMIRSMILAGAVLKIRILYLWNFNRMILILSSLLLFPAVLILSVSDGKVFIALSSVLHMSCCIVILLWVIIYMGYIHIVLSPLIFIQVYIMYISSRSRYYLKIRVLVFLLILMNFRFPYLGAFYSELYIITYVGLLIVIIIIMYFISRYVIMKSLNGIGTRLFYIPILLLYIVVI